MTLTLYIARRFLATVGLVFLVFFGILMLIDMIEQLRRFRPRASGWREALRLSLLNVPERSTHPAADLRHGVDRAVPGAGAVVGTGGGPGGRAVGLRFLVTPVVVSLALRPAGRGGAEPDGCGHVEGL
jgi:lipopolysaccharide export system permease protein